MTGDVTGSATFDGSNNISITATVANNSHNHSASNITSGTLAIARGGTGATTAVNACKNLGAMYLDPNDTAISGEASAINAQTFAGMTYAQVKADILDAVIADDDGQTGVYSVNGKSGNVLLSASDVGVAESEHNHDGVYVSTTTFNTMVGSTKVSDQITSAISGIVHPVTSVNGKTGAVSLSQTSLVNNTTQDLNSTVDTYNNAFMRYVGIDATNMPASYGDNSGAVIQMGNGSSHSGQIFFGFGNSAFIRARRTGDWGDWYQFYTTLNKPTYSDVGAAAASHTHPHTHDQLQGWSDTRNVTTKPNDYNSALKCVGIKTPTGSGTIDGSIYSTLVGIRGWSDSSGGNSHEIAFTGNGKLYHRHGSTDTWGSWGQILTSANFSLSGSTLTITTT